MNQIFPFLTLRHILARHWRKISHSAFGAQVIVSYNSAGDLGMDVSGPVFIQSADIMADIWRLFLCLLLDPEGEMSLCCLLLPKRT